MAGDRETFLRRVREAAARGRNFPVRTMSEFPTDVGYVGGGPDLVERFADEFAAVGGHPHHAVSDDDARAILRRVLSEARTTLAAERAAIADEMQLPPCSLVWNHPLLDRLGVGGLLEEVGFGVFPWPGPESDQGGFNQEQLFAASVGVSSVDWAVAETGTLVVAARPGQPRAVSLLPPVHVAVVARDQILPDLFDLFETLSPEGGQTARAADLPSNLVLITGPSKTGDIELKLTTGVHGPGDVHVVILDPS